MNRHMFTALIVFTLIWWGPGLLAPHRFDTAHMITFILVGCLWLAWKLGQREKWLGWTYTALIIGTGVNLFTNRTVLLKGMRDGAVRADITLVPLLGCLSIGAAVCIFLWAANLSASDSRFLAKSIAFVGAISGVLGIIQLYSGDFMGIYGVNPVKDVGASVGLWGNPGLQGITLALTLPLALFALPWASIPIMAGLVASKSVIGFLAAATATVYYLSLIKIWWVILILAVAFTVFLKIEDPQSFRHLDRLRVWKATAWLWPRYPTGRFLGDKSLPVSAISSTFGWGLGMFKKRFPIWDYRSFRIGLIREEGPPDKDRTRTGENTTVTGRPWHHPHNEFLSLLFEGGPAAILPFLVFVFGFLLPTTRHKDIRGEARAFGACLLAGLVSALWHFPFHFVPSAVILSIAASRLSVGETR